MALAGGSLVGIRLGTTLSVADTEKYAIENSQINSQDFSLFKFNNYYYYFRVSSDVDKTNELHMFVNADNKFYGAINLNGRYKHYLSVTSDKEVGSVYLTMKNSNDEKNLKDDVILYYSANKNKIEKCVYYMKLNGEDKEGYVYEYTQKVQRNFPFAFIIPVVTNYRNAENGDTLLMASFYDASGNLVYEDIRVEKEEWENDKIEIQPIY